MDEELVEKVAEAMVAAGEGADPDGQMPLRYIYARAAIQAMMDAGWKSPEEVEDALLNETEGLRSHMREGGD